MNSRLDRLFVLLDTGSNESIRIAAAKQIGQVQKIQPNDLNYLLKRIEQYSTKPVWETRIASGHAIKYVLENVNKRPSDHVQIVSDNKVDIPIDIQQCGIINSVDLQDVIKHFDLNKVTTLAADLLSSEIDDDLAHQSADKGSGGSKASSRGGSGLKRVSKKAHQDQLKRQRQLINKELGIGMVDSLNLGIKSTDIVSNEDLLNDCDDTAKREEVPKSRARKEAKSAIESALSNYDKIINHLLSSGKLNPNCIKSTHSNTKNNSYDKIEGQWPLASITDGYLEKLYDPSWEVRHGAAIALREIIRLQGECAGKFSSLSISVNRKLNQLWLVEFALKGIVVLALDKFGDFLFDQVVAPVRENVAQLVSCCISHLDANLACEMMKLIAKMSDSPQWERRHGAILGLKYSLHVVDKSIAKKILYDCFDAIFRCLHDPVDDVSAEAAVTLVPVKDLVLETVPERGMELIRFLWDHLSELDELTSSTSNIILLLSSLITTSSTELSQDELIKSIPRLWILTSHSSTSVRVIVLKALASLIDSCKCPCLSWMPECMLASAFRLIYQRSIVENAPEVRCHLEDVWFKLLRTTPELEHEQRINLLRSTSQYLNYWLCLSQQPANVPIERANPLWLNISPDGSESKIKPEGETYIGSYNFNAEDHQQQKIEIVECRLLASKLLGKLYATLINELEGNELEVQHVREALKYLGDMFVHHLSGKSANQRTYSSWTLECWAQSQRQLLSKQSRTIDVDKILPQNLAQQLSVAIKETNLCYDELASSFTNLQQLSREFLATLKRAEIDLAITPISEKLMIYSLAQIQTLCDLNVVDELAKAQSKFKPTNSSKQQAKKVTTLTKTCTIISNDLHSEICNKQISLRNLMRSANRSQKMLSISASSSLSCAMIGWNVAPDNFDLLKKPLLESIECEENQSLLNKSIRYLIILLDKLFENKESNEIVIESIISTLIGWVNENAIEKAEEFGQQQQQQGSPGMSSTETNDRFHNNNYKGEKDVDSRQYTIVLLDNLQKQAEMRLPRRLSSLNSTSLSATSNNVAGTPCQKRSHSTSLELVTDKQHIDQQASFIRTAGSTAALRAIIAHLGSELDKKLTRLWNYVTKDLLKKINTICKESSKQIVDSKSDRESENKIISDDLVGSLNLLAIISESIEENLRKRNLLDLLPQIIRLLNQANPIVRHYTSQSVGLLTKSMFKESIVVVNQQIIPLLSSPTDIFARCGSIEAIAQIIENLQFELVDHVNLFVIHILRRMSDQNHQVRLLATHCFGRLLTLMPLNSQAENLNCSGKIDNNSTDHEQNQDQDHQSQFIYQLLNPKTLSAYELPFDMETKLRSYQQDGLNWLAFLNRFNLNGILCDEMGLGKTLMTICMIASDHFKSLGDKHANKLGPSLIICPTTLTYHWLHEINKFLPKSIQRILNPIVYNGSHIDRAHVRCLIDGKPKDNDSKLIRANLVIGSYDIIRNDIDFFREIQWNYCVLDEGHIIKNVKTKLSRAIRLLRANHRLILSGTPIQNNVTELWSLFDFLMPGLLGSERQFNSRYGRPILQSREVKCSARDQEAGALAMESLHRQVLPFILRRLKEDVLNDLPPKIIQDYYCELSPLQKKLYDDFTSSKLCQNVTKRSLLELDADYDVATEDNTTHVAANSKNSTHVFQALQYLKNVCNHPKMVMTEKHPKYKEFQKFLKTEMTNINDIGHSSKLSALKQLLIDCGIGSMQHQQQQQNQTLGEPRPSNNQVSQINDQMAALEESIVTQHRALIFCQVKSMVSIIENDLLKKHMPTVTYLKLDGSVSQSQRFEVVNRFNDDPSIDILLLTTQIGGLGLNLTGADTVIFVEHDWNPTKDLQAMDRAHRIGQKKVVNVYRLITKGTLEEKIMGLQKFKTMVSNSVINQDNSGLATMNVDQLLELFDNTNSGKQANQQINNKETSNQAEITQLVGSGGNSTKKRKKQTFVDLLPELWNQAQYEAEYDLNNFVSSLKG